MTGPESGAALLARMKPQLREVHTEICLRPDLLDEHAVAESELAEIIAEDAVGRPRMGSGASAGDTVNVALSPAAKKQAKKVDTLEKQIVEHSIKFKLRGLPKDEWRVLTESNPPRKDNQFDLLQGYNRDAVADAIVRASIYEPVFEDCTEAGCEHLACGTWQQLVLFCNDGEWEELRRSASEANGRVNPNPKSELASRVLGSRAPTSKRRAPGKSPRAGSTAGNPSGS